MNKISWQNSSLQSSEKSRTAAPSSTEKNNLYTIQKYKILDSLILTFRRFFEQGHTFSAGDSIHSVIERKSRKQSVFTQKQWVNLIGSAKEENPYEVQSMEQNDIKDFAEIASLFDWTKMKTQRVKELVFDLTHNSLVRVRYDNFESELQTPQIFKKGMDYRDILENVVLPPAYKNKFPLEAKKAKDIKKMLVKYYIPDDGESHEWYINEIL